MNYPLSGQNNFGHNVIVVQGKSAMIVDQQGRTLGWDIFQTLNLKAMPNPTLRKKTNFGWILQSKGRKQMTFHDSHECPRVWQPPLGQPWANLFPPKPQTAFCGQVTSSPAWQCTSEMHWGKFLGQWSRGTGRGLERGSRDRIWPMSRDTRTIPTPARPRDPRKTPLRSGPRIRCPNSYRRGTQRLHVILLDTFIFISVANRPQNECLVRGHSGRMLSTKMTKRYLASKIHPQSPASQFPPGDAHNHTTQRMSCQFKCSVNPSVFYFRVYNSPARLSAEIPASHLETKVALTM